jgi:hypothetical protein
MLWHDTQPLVRRLLIGAFALGAVAFVLGWLGDERDFWVTRPFATNLLSSFTAAMFSIPLAVVVLQRVLFRQQEHADSVSAVRNAASATSQLMDMRGSFLPKGHSHTLDAGLALEGVLSELNALGPNGPVPHAAQSRLRSVIADIEECLPNPSTYGELYSSASMLCSEVEALRLRRFEDPFSWAQEIPALSPVYPRDIEQVMIKLRTAYAMSSDPNHPMVGASLESLTAVEGAIFHLTPAIPTVIAIPHFVAEFTIANRVVLEHAKPAPGASTRP